MEGEHSLKAKLASLHNKYYYRKRGNRVCSKRNKLYENKGMKIIEEITDDENEKEWINKEKLRFQRMKSLRSNKMRLDCS